MIRKSTKIITTVSAVTLLVSVAVYIIFLGVVANQKEAHIVVAEERIETKAHQESLQKLTETLKETEGERTALLTRFIKEEDVIDVISLVESLGNEQGVVFTTNSLDVMPINDTLESLVISMKVEGDYTRVHKVLTLLEHLPYQTIITRAQIQESGDVGWVGVFEIQITKFKKI